ncbi:MAG: N-acetylmuramoyl-L-alanine amidase CwlD [Bacilli bacterium]|jgi:N-acetylmuramoyl-L-alanine amidase|nr:N-acetylmuramoyl-L-alanine amidase CwlD [Bacilli bacterium]
MWKQKILMLVIFLVGIMGIGYVGAFQNDMPLLGKVIYLDAGHGGADPGALYKSIKEKDINLAISKKLEEELSALGAIVYQTRYGDYDLSVPYASNRKRSDLSRRGNIINDSGCDLYLSIHLNADSSLTWQGAQVFYDDINPENETIAKMMQALFKKKLYTQRKEKKVNDLYLSKRTDRPGVLLELGFLSNPNERYLLKTENYQTKLSHIITEGVVAYFNQKK